jgi:hypothetical protein
MKRRLRRALTATIYPLLGIAALLAMSGCAAVPAMSLASGLLKPAPPASAGTATPPPDLFTTLAQRLGIPLPPPAAAPAGANDTETQTDAPSVDRPAKTATASK